MSAWWPEATGTSEFYEASDHDLLIVRDGLGHRSVAVTQIYLPTSADRMEACMRETDWTHRNPRRSKLPAKPGHFGRGGGEGGVGGGMGKGRRAG